MQRLFSALNRHDHATMASCYHPNATFRDIAFDLRGQQQVHAMWRMICAGDIRATFEIVDADDTRSRVTLIAKYTFGKTARKGSGRPVRNVIDSQFHFRDGLILDHRDFCDARQWAAMAIGGFSGFLAGRFRFLRSWKARKKLREFSLNRPGRT